MIDEKEKRVEAKRLLGFIFFEFKKEITEDLVSYWLKFLAGLTLKDSWAAARFMMTQKIFGEPRVGDFMQAYYRLREAKPTPAYNPNAGQEIITDAEALSFLQRLQIEISGDDPAKQLAYDRRISKLLS